MLSVLIPIYNFDVRSLVNELDKQCRGLGIDYEILCYDDGSLPKIKAGNKSLAQLSEQVYYQELRQNLGRAKIRNLMGEIAKYDNLLFLDCDSAVVSGDYIKKYIDQIDNRSLINGGRIYTKKTKTRVALLHWKYGKQRESRSATARSKAPVLYFHSNNFLVPKFIFSRLNFDEDIEGYGYEDLLFAQQIAKADIPIIHINNPIEHLGLQSSHVFVEKAKSAIDNLINLEEKGHRLNTSLQNVAGKLRILRLSGLYTWLYKSRQKAILRNLHSSHPSVTLFNYYKLNYYLTQKKSHSF